MLPSRGCPTAVGRERRDRYYAPYPGHASAADFRRFRDDPLVLFEDELPDRYRG